MATKSRKQATAAARKSTRSKAKVTAGKSGAVVKVALLGFGTVGSSVATVLTAG
jgi:phosphoglycerate dehydrogenase-like enzyme